MCRIQLCYIDLIENRPTGGMAEEGAAAARTNANGGLSRRLSPYQKGHEVDIC